MPNRDFAWFEAELGRRLVEIQKTNQTFTMEQVVRDLDRACIAELSDDALVCAAQRFARYHRLPWADARGLRERKILAVAIATFVVAALGSTAAVVALIK